MPRTLLIGDIHGCFDELRDLLDAAAITDDDTVISVGDLVDRGPDPAGVIDLLRGRPNTVVVCGNHERKHVRAVFSYGQEVTRAQLGGRYAADVAWFGTLPYHHETAEVRVVHWGHFPGVPLDEVPEDVRAGTTSGEQKLRARYGETAWYEHYEDETPIVFGHAVVGEEPLILRDRVYGLDTGCCHGLWLTGLILPERRIVRVRARADHWTVVRRTWQEPVLRTRDWGAMTFAQLDKKVAALRGTEAEGGFLDDIVVWSTAVRAALPTLAARLEAEAARLEAEGGEVGRAMAGHPAASWLQRLRMGRLSAEHLGCSTPAQVVALGRALGVEVAEAP